MTITNVIAMSTAPLLEIFGRSGGGGSSSGGGSSGGGIDFLIVLLGYVPMHFVGSVLRKKMPIIAASIIGWLVAIIYAIICCFFGFWGVLIAIAALVGMGAGLYNWFNKIGKLAARAKEAQELAVKKDSSWDIALLNDQVARTFTQYQTDWSNNDSESMRLYLSPNYVEHNKLMVLALRQLCRRNIIQQPSIIKLDLIDIQDDENYTNDRFVMQLMARAVDELYDTKTNTLLFRDPKPFCEFWRFVRKDKDNWLLEGIGQATEDPFMLNNELAAFAIAKGYFFSPDWGWLLLPSRGQIFESGKFGQSDINNHIIGVYNNTLIQIYNYIPKPTGESNVLNYLIAQVAVPKSYGNIVVRKKRLLSFVGTKGLRRVTMEWGDFNKRYEVWASDMEKVTSFELLNPSFMVKLQELPFEVNIEVVDNIVYLYSAKVPSTSQNYEIILSILYQAFKEMRM